MLYDDWPEEIAKRFQKRFDDITVTHNFDYGPEFEVAICEMLRTILPRRFGVCRGFVVGRNGERAGDDIIVFDAQRFPTVRALADDLARKESIPAEAVLAYIEAKHTLTVEGDDGQSLAKATKQVNAVKAVPRAPVAHSEAVIPGANLGPHFTVTPPPGFPSTRNPYYSAIWARNVKSSEPDAFRAFSERLIEISPELEQLPDAIVAGPSVLALPVVRNNDKNVSVKPFVCENTELCICLNNTSPWGLAFAHLLWAIEWVRLSDLPWSTMISEQLKIGDLGLATPPMRGTKFEVK